MGDGVLFLSFDKEKNEVLFYKKYQEHNNIKKPIVPIASSQTDIIYLDKNDGEIYQANKEFYKNKIDNVGVGSIQDKKAFMKSFENFTASKKEALINKFDNMKIKLSLLSLYKDLVPIASSKKDIIYLDKNDGEIYQANKKYYQHTVDNVRISSMQDKKAFMKSFENFTATRKEALINKFDNMKIKLLLFKSYLSKTDKNDVDQSFVTSVFQTNNHISFYEAMKNMQYIKIVNLGQFSYQNLQNLENQIDQLIDSYEFKFITEFGKLSHKTSYPSSNSSNAYILFFIDNKQLFKLSLPINCNNYKTYQKKGTRSKGILIFRTVVYKSMFEYKEYKCMISQDVINKTIRSVKKLIDSFDHSKPLKIKNSWKFTKKKLLYDISAEQTAIGKALSDGSSSNQCYKVLDNCKDNCKIKNKNNGFFIFSSSDKDKCEDYCYAGFNACKDGKTSKMEKNICKAKCVGYSDEGGFFSRSKYEKCMDDCLKKY